jgi:flagellar biosynthesis protein FliP
MDAISFGPFLGGLIALVTLTCFAKVFTVLSILRVGVGLEGLGMGSIVAAVSLLISLVVMQPQLEPFGGPGAIFSGELKTSGAELQQHFTPFLEKHSDSQVLARLMSRAESQNAEPENVSADQSQEATQSTPSNNFSLLALAFLLTELKEAFEVGLLLLLPFVVIDLLVVNVIAALGIRDFPARVASLPLKLLLFVSLDGWALITEKLLHSY